MGGLHDCYSCRFVNGSERILQTVPRCWFILKWRRHTGALSNARETRLVISSVASDRLGGRGDLKEMSG